MPGLSGVELLKEIRRGNPDLPIVVVTGWAGPQDLDEVRRLGVTDIVEKPWALKYVDEALRTLRSDGNGSRPQLAATRARGRATRLVARSGPEAGAGSGGRRPRAGRDA